MTDAALQRLQDVARWLRVTAYGRSTHPPSVLLTAAAWLERPLDESPRKDRCRRCDDPLPPYLGRGARRKLCESCGRPPRLGQYRANIPDRSSIGS